MNVQAARVVVDIMGAPAGGALRKSERRRVREEKPPQAHAEDADRTFSRQHAFTLGG